MALLFSLPAQALAAFAAALRGAFAPPAPLAPKPQPVYALPLRVQVALQAAARARRA